MLTVTTTHVKQGWHRRENIPASDEVTVIEHFVKHGDLLTHISVTEDPIYLAEPLIKSEEFDLVPNPNTFNPFYPCEYVEGGRTGSRPGAKLLCRRESLCCGVCRQT